MRMANWNLLNGRHMGAVDAGGSIMVGITDLQARDARVGPGDLGGEAECRGETRCSP